MMEIQRKYGSFPFTLRSLEDEKKALMGIQECKQHGLLTPYDVLAEKKGMSSFRIFLYVKMILTTVRSNYY